MLDAAAAGAVKQVPDTTIGGMGHLGSGLLVQAGVRSPDGKSTLPPSAAVVRGKPLWPRHPSHPR